MLNDFSTLNWWDLRLMTILSKQSVPTIFEAIYSRTSSRAEVELMHTYILKKCL